MFTRVTKPMLGTALAVGLWLLPRAGTAQGLMLTGYADLETNLQNVGSDDAQFYFDNHHFNLIGIGKLLPNLLAAVEIEYEHAGEEIALEYGYLSYMGIPNVRIQAGKFIVPFGRFNKDIHPTWINKMPDTPHGFRDIFPQTYSDVGLWVSGAAPLGTSGTRLTYDAFVVNGLLGDDGAGIRGMRDNDREQLSGGGRDDNKAVGGRLGIDLPQGLDAGGSLYVGNYLDDPAANLTLSMLGVDAAFHHRALEVRTEAVFVDQAATGGDLTKRGGYAQVAYLVSRQVEPVVRFSMRDMPGDNQDARRLSFGMNYYLASNAAVRLAYHLNMETTGFESDNNSLIAQITTSF